VPAANTAAALFPSAVRAACCLERWQRSFGGGGGGGERGKGKRRESFAVTVAPERRRAGRFLAQQPTQSESGKKERDALQCRG
jgi:hypothetical protein